MGEALYVLFVIIFVGIWVAKACGAIKDHSDDGFIKKPVPQEEDEAAPEIIQRAINPDKIKRIKNLSQKGMVKEKTHNHEGEVVGDLGRLEDRNNDWLARQIREENRVSRRLEL